MKKSAFARPALMSLAFFALATALYSLAVTGLGAALFPRQAGGSLVVEAGAIRGSSLLGQAFSRADRFHGRPSAVAYDPASGGASNLGPTSAALAQSVAARRAALLAENGASSGEPPDELLLASGSGLDPDISPQAALYQAPRVARALGLGSAGAASLEALVRSRTEGRGLGFMGEPRVNVLALNLELERLYGR
jgi:potassium-transporting ATPase KdpC subunit